MGEPIDWSDVSKLHIETEAGAKVLGVEPCSPAQNFVWFDKQIVDYDRGAPALYNVDGTHHFDLLPPITNVTSPLPYFIHHFKAQRYETLDGAETKALEMARQFPGDTFYVVKPVASFKQLEVEPPVEIERF